ncbi:hypothetical protein CSKR_200260 [Clonorchis sinensis]|uniref:Uncharacterized protein n=1 Tax=Clonorchis sinensis TaxID=79923 RepID=A0A8T1LZL1_CLOSI|nr:hypothetical protein CSKR_200260 [Clonorchis sinensis]
MTTGQAKGPMDILKSLMERMTTMCVMQFHKNYPAFREYLKMDQVDEKLMKLGKICRFLFFSTVPEDGI